MAIQPISNPNFKIVDIDPTVVADVLDAFVTRGSKLTGVSLDDINTGVIEAVQNERTVELAELLEKGMKLFDAIVWLTANRPTSHPLKIDRAMKKEDVVNLHEIARCVFYCYFFLLTQARYPASQNDANPPNVANFLKTIMGMDQPQHTYVEKICSFTPQKFDAIWARNVSFVGLGQETLSRFGLGVAGYRMFGPFKLYNPSNPVPSHLQNAFNFAKKVATSEATWDVHPLTRNPAILSKRGNLNKNLGNLIRAIYTEDEIKLMAKAKVIYGAPIDEPAHRNYLSWESTDDISGTSQIFRSNRA